MTRSGCDGARAQPTGEKGLGATVRTGGVKVADAGSPGRIEHGVGVRLHGLDAAVMTEVAGVVEVDIARPAQRGQTKPQRRDGQVCTAQGACLHRSVNPYSLSMTWWRKNSAASSNVAAVAVG